MNCQNCGAPLELGDNRTILTCHFCDSNHRLKPDSNEGDRVISLDRPAGVICPCCDCELTEASIDGRPAHYCPGCHGILVSAPIFAEVARNRRHRYRGPEQIPTLIDPEELSRSIHCPNCRQQMEVHPHYGPGRAIIDSCSVCHLVWLDNSELASIERTPGSRR